MATDTPDPTRWFAMACCFQCALAACAKVARMAPLTAMLDFTDTVAV